MYSQVTADKPSGPIIQTLLERLSNEIAENEVLLNEVSYAINRIDFPLQDKEAIGPVPSKEKTPETVTEKLSFLIHFVERNNNSLKIMCNRLRNLI